MKSKRAARLALPPAAALTLVLAALVTLAQGTQFVKGPYIQSVTTTGVTIMWESDDVQAAVVEWGPTGMLGRRIATRWKGEPLAMVRIEGLEPGTRYYYRVTEGEAMSRTYSFMTLPDAPPFRFVVYGDSRSRPGDHARVIAGIAGAEPAFVLHVGDFVDDGREASQWRPQFFAPAGPLLARVGMFTAAGNHERESPNYYNYLGAHYLGDNTSKPWYSFDCANVHVAILNSCLDLSPGSEQYEWLRADLASTTKTWRFVVLHHPLYSSGSHGSDFTLREHIEPVLRRYSVDMVFAGHDHMYERTRPIVSAFSEARPVTHVVTGGGGAPLYSPGWAYFTAVARRTLHFCTVDVAENSIYFQAFDDQGRRFDQMRIVKLAEIHVNDYPGEGVPLELSQLETSLRRTLARRELGSSAAGRRERVTFHFQAPEWGGAALSLEWGPAPDVEVSPSSALLEIPAGEKAEATFEIDWQAGAVAAPRLAVKVLTSIGSFDYDASPLTFPR